MPHPSHGRGKEILWPVQVCGGIIVLVATTHGICHPRLWELGFRSFAVALIRLLFLVRIILSFVGIIQALDTIRR